MSQENQTAACYIRVSTEDQTEYSPAAQLAAIRRYCANNRITLLPNCIFTDEGKSGKSVKHRTAFLEMLSRAKQKPKPFDMILVHKFDRFARSREDSIVYKSLLKKEYGIKVVSITETIENDKMSIIMESMLEAMAEYYSVNLGEEVKKGMTERVRRGEPVTTPPYGYRMENKQLVIDPREAEIVRRIYREFLEGSGFFAIAHRLTEDGVLNQNGNPFHTARIEYILNNPVYAGYIRWNPTERTKDYNHPDLIVAKGQHTPIIDHATFTAVKKRCKQLKARPRLLTRSHVALSHWLVGLVQCAHCGKAIVKSGSSFACNGYIKGACTHRSSVPLNKLSNMVCTAIAYTLQKQDAVFALVTVDEEPQQAEQEAKLALEMANDRLNRAYLAFEKGIDSLENYAENKKRISAEIAAIEAKLRHEPPNPKNYTVQFYSALQTVYAVLCNPNASVAEKHDALTSVVSKMVFHKEADTLDIYYFVDAV